MKELKIKVELLSPLQLGSGRADVIIDSEAVHDKYGLPYFPGKRFRGLLYESAIEMAEISGGEWFTKADVAALFGHAGDDTVLLRTDNLTLENYTQLQEQWQQLEAEYPEFFTPESLWESYTSIRYQTAIDKKTGIADDGSLRNLRVVDSGNCFFGSIYLLGAGKKDTEIISKALLNLRYAGAKRNRGCGRIKCSLINSDGRK